MQVTSIGGHAALKSASLQVYNFFVAPQRKLRSSKTPLRFKPLDVTFILVFFSSFFVLDFTHHKKILNCTLRKTQ
jgi:hypothetical protein